MRHLLSPSAGKKPIVFSEQHIADCSPMSSAIAEVLGLILLLILRGNGIIFTERSQPS